MTGRICGSNNAAERAMCGLALGRKSEVVAVCWFRPWGGKGGPDLHAHPTAKLNDVDPQAWLAGVLARIADTLVPRNSRAESLRPRSKGYFLIAAE
jgi:transposase